jgi:IS605 OrfB family transposase
VTYTISYRPESRRRWYIDASWAYKADEKAASAGVSTAASASTAAASRVSGVSDGTVTHTPANSRVVAVDLNADHIAAWVIDEHGNPVGRPYRIPLYLKGLSAGRREGHVRWAISQLIHIAIDKHCRFIACEDLGWADETGRDESVQGKAFRHTISGMPTSLFKKSLSAMARHSGLSVVAVDPAYTSQWGAEFWQEPQILSHHIETTVHEAASMVTGRRSQDRSAYRAARGTRYDRLDRIGNTTADGRVILAGAAADDRAIGARVPMAESG